MKIRKMENKELKKVVGQCCCKIVGKPSVYETDSCCLADCKKDGRDTAHYTILQQHCPVTFFSSLFSIFLISCWFPPSDRL